MPREHAVSFTQDWISYLTMVNKNYRVNRVETLLYVYTLKLQLFSFLIIHDEFHDCDKTVQFFITNILFVSLQLLFWIHQQYFIIAYHQREF